MLLPSDAPRRSAWVLHDDTGVLAAFEDQRDALLAWLAAAREEIADSLEGALQDAAAAGHAPRVASLETLRPLVTGDLQRSLGEPVERLAALFRAVRAITVADARMTVSHVPLRSSGARAETEQLIARLDAARVRVPPQPRKSEA
jgi:hypothetical protein